MEIIRNGSQPSVKGPSDWFTGTVRIDPLFQAPDPAFVQGASVTFEPGARTAWHTHPLGQTLRTAQPLELTPRRTWYLQYFHLTNITHGLRYRRGESSCRWLRSQLKPN